MSLTFTDTSGYSAEALHLTGVAVPPVVTVVTVRYHGVAHTVASVVTVVCTLCDVTARAVPALLTQARERQHVSRLVVAALTRAVRAALVTG